MVAAEQVVGAETRQVLAKGIFVRPDPRDPVHYGRGAVTIYADLAHLGGDFEVGPGPKFHVYLVPRTTVTSSADVKGTMFVDIGRLRAFKGSQNYPIPAGVILGDGWSVGIWCERFSVLISPATLKEP